MTDYVINVDWFQTMLLGGLVKDHPLEKYEYKAGAIVLKRNHKRGSKHFKYSYDVAINGKEFGFIFSDPRNSEILNAQFIQFQALNNVLYEIGWLDRYKMLVTALEWEHVNMTRLDIALDGHGFFDTWKKYQQGKYEKRGKAQEQEFYAGKRNLTGFDVGSRKSNKWVTCYNASAEKKRSRKQYVIEMWEKAGLDTSTDVERLEVKLRNDAVKRIVGFDWEQLDDFEYLASIMRTQLVNLFDFVHASKDTNISRAKKVRAISWNKIGGLLLPTESTRQANEVWTAMITSKKMFKTYLKTKRTEYADLAQEMAWNHNCIDWYKEKTAEWTREWEFSERFRENTYLAQFERYNEHDQILLAPASIGN